MAVEVQSINNWTQAKQAFDALRARGYAFRGQARASWNLETTLQRLRSIDPVKDEWLVRRYFERRARPLLPAGVKVDASPISTWLSLLQHYGGPTRLLDFTLSPYVAALFALEKPGDEDAAVWAVHPLYIQAHAVSMIVKAWGLSESLATSLAFTNQEELLLRVLGYASGAGNPPISAAVPIEPINFDLRQSNQQALFLCPLTLDGPLDTILEAIPAEKTGNTWKLTLSQSMRAAALRDLIAMNVTPASLFPGLDGLGRTAGLQARFSTAEHDALMTALTTPSFMRSRQTEES